MTEKEFVVDDATYIVTISYFDGGSPGKLSGPPEDCYPEEAPEVEFDDEVEFATDECNKVKTMNFCDFVMIYANEYTEGDTDKAASRIEAEIIEEIIEQAAEYEP